MSQGKSALLVMGCPEVPVQNSMVIYLAHKLKKSGWDVTVAGTNAPIKLLKVCLLYTSDAADDLLCVDLGGRRIIKKKNTK